MIPDKRIRQILGLSAEPPKPYSDAAPWVQAEIIKYQQQMRSLRIWMFSIYVMCVAIFVLMLTK